MREVKEYVGLFSVCSYVGKEKEGQSKAYEELEMEIIEFDAEDVIRTSNPDESEGPLNPDF